jgi:hypothetical protein
MPDGSFYQPDANALPLMRRGDGHLGNVEVSVQLMPCEEPYRLIPSVNGHPQRLIPAQGSQDAGIHRVAVGQPRQTDVPEDRCRRTLDGTEFA